ncbi:hypothetical protein J19TS2_30900 [Cohnella xylanilytica]|uniref:hypothetical protein n=1 Tax=Cohnella xylanilytica TaxID=557555 RepID=UPI001B1ED46D|nr:hypothetical protein [Cohnella xylanilytica]GIO13535.1 hypothetical protein J19TS2_30900 [Cohnella xylanilytica]
MTMSYWPRIPPKEPTGGIKAFRGVNKLDQFSMDVSYSPRTKNLISTLAPAMTTRPGFSVLGAPIGTRVLGLAVWKTQELHAVFNDGTWRKWNGSAWTTLKSGLNTSAVWSFANYKGNLGTVNLVGTNGIDPMQHYDGSSVTNLPTAPAGANFIETHDNRLYCAVGLKIYFSPIGIADNWNLVEQTAADGGNLDKNTPEGENIVGLRAGSGHVTVFFPSSSWELYGTSADNYSYEPIAEDIGGLNDQCIVNLEGVIYFLDETGIYLYAGGTRPKKQFSAPVQWYVDNMNQSAKLTSCMGADGRYLYVAIPMGANATSPDTILVYDSQNQIWNVWENIPAVMFTKWGPTLYMADAQGRVLRVGGKTDNGVAIVSEWQGKPLGAASMGQLVRCRGLWITADKPAGSKLQVYITDRPDDAGWKLAGTFGESQDIQNKSIPVAPNLQGNSRWWRPKLVATGPVTVYEIAWDQIDLPIR